MSAEKTTWDDTDFDLEDYSMVYYSDMLDSMGVFNPLISDPAGQFTVVVEIEAGKIYYTNLEDFANTWMKVGRL